jgi:hypothetical protein
LQARCTRVVDRQENQRRLTTPARAALATVALVAAMLVPEVSGAAPSQDPQQELDQVEQRQGEIALEIDALEAQQAEVAAALANLQANVAAQEAALTDAIEAADSAEADVTAAEAEVAAAQTRVQVLNAATDQLAVDAFVDPPANNTLEALEAESLSDAIVMKALVDIQAQSDAELMAELERAQANLETVRDEKADVAAAAEQAQMAAEGQVAAVRAARDQQAQFAADVQLSLEHKLTEQTMNADRAADLQGQIDALAAQLAAAGVDPAAASPTVVGDVSVVTVSCPTGGSITVAESIGGSVQQLLNAARADGVSLCGGGYRSSDDQIAVRRSNCGTSNYAIYEMPASDCTPPTARPGSSQHEQGLAIDFTQGGSTLDSSDSGFRWLDSNAAGYGLYNLPSEPWHWSTTGR